MTTHAEPPIETRLPKIYSALEYLRMESGAFGQLTRKYMREEFNPKTPDVSGVRYVMSSSTSIVQSNERPPTLAGEGPGELRFR